MSLHIKLLLVKTLLSLCEGWHFTHMRKPVAWLHHFSKRGSLGP